VTQPSEQSIRKALEEAGVEDVDHMLWAISVIPDDTRARLLLALARRIEAEAVPVAWMYESPSSGSREYWPEQRFDGFHCGWTETPLYAHPPKEPTT